MTITRIGVLIIVAAAIAVALLNLKSGYLVWDRGKVSMPRFLKQTEIRTADLPSLVDAMSRGTAPIRYAALIFSTPERPTERDAVNLQVSVENGKPGFDWVLLVPRNIEDQDKFKAFAHAQGFEPKPELQNGVSSLRVECPDVAKFAADVASGMYQLPATEPVGLVYEGFDWRQT